MKFKQVNSTFIFSSIVFTAFFFFPQNAFAVCPVCTVAIGAGVGLSRYFGIDDVITGLWIGAFIVASALWLFNFLKAKSINFPYLKMLLLFLTFLVSVVPLYFGNFLNHPFNQIFGVDKIIFGISVGVVLFFISQKIDGSLRAKNNFKVYFPYQKVVIPLTILFVVSVFLYFFL